MFRSRGALVLLGLTCMAMAACEPRSESPVGQVLRGEHELRKMVQYVDREANVSASFFLFIGGMHGSVTEHPTVKFAWKMNDGVYALSALPLEKIRVQLDEKTEVPTIRFRWRPAHDERVRSGIPAELDSWVVYAVVRCRPEDWPVHIQLPLNATGGGQ